MNNRIETLKKLATISVNNPLLNSDGKVVCDNWEQVVSLSKFANLVVQECIVALANEIVYNSHYTERNKTIGDMMIVVKKHFGVD